MKINKKPIIVCAVFTLLFVLAAVLCIVIPMMITPKYEGPVQVSETICLKYDGNYEAYMLRGKIKNVSDETVTLKNNHGLVIKYDNSKRVISSGWMNGKDIVLAPDEEFNFATTELGSEGSSSINRVSVTVDGTEYIIYKYDSTPRTLAFFFGIFAVIFIIVTLGQVKAQKDLAKRNMAIDGLCAQIGGKGAVITAVVSDKSENRKAAAKTAGWVFGAVISTIFTGRGVYKVYGGSQQSQFILNENSLYMVHGTNMQDLEMLSNENYPAESVSVNKKKITLKCVDGKRSLTFMPDKNCPLTVEEIEKNLNNIFFNAPAPAPVEQPVSADGSEPNEVAATENDPFDEFKGQSGEVTPASASAPADEAAPADGADGNEPAKD